MCTHCTSSYSHVVVRSSYLGIACCVQLFLPVFFLLFFAARRFIHALSSSLLSFCCRRLVCRSSLFFCSLSFSPLASRSLLFSLLDYYFSKLATLQYLFAIHYLIHAARLSKTRCSLSSLLAARNSFLVTFSSLGQCRVLDIWSRLLASCLWQHLIAVHTFDTYAC